MQVIRSRERIEQVHPPSLRATLLLRAAEAEEFVDDFSELVSFILIEPGVAPSDLSGELGREVHLITPDASEIVGDHLALVYVLSDDGAGASVFVRIDPAEAAQLNPISHKPSWAFRERQDR
ncbi:hypothetical protein KAK07_13320 [Ideonella sp. 4Y16]|uniref:hypothetical protein n=1 Tax=Ideonella alba TaxID=2824118 RepID=UPI001B360037|nr:hypothetical protein [Ideonella alba]MBQ0944317.1 hypothetical protein [Ideonella alba]